MRGTVVRIGVNAWKAFDDGTPWAHVGDKVVFRKYAGEVIKDGDVEYRVVNDEDILCRIRERVFGEDYIVTSAEIGTGFGLARPMREGDVVPTERQIAGEA